MDITYRESLDQGLRNYMTSIYNWMIIGVLVSAAGAYAGIASGLPAWFAQHQGALLIAALAPLGIILAMGVGLRSAGINSLRLGYLTIALLEGLTITLLLSKYQPASIIAVFLATSASFAGLSLWGYTTRKNLSSWGNFLIAALFGLIAVMLINIFVQIPGMNMLISYAGVLIFAGLIAYDTQKLKDAYSLGMDEDMEARVVLWGALDLYLDFINMFIFLLRIFGNSSDD